MSCANGFEGCYISQPHEHRTSSKAPWQIGCEHKRTSYVCTDCGNAFAIDAASPPHSPTRAVAVEEPDVAKLNELGLSIVADEFYRMRARLALLERVCGEMRPALEECLGIVVDEFTGMNDKDLSGGAIGRGRSALKAAEEALGKKT